MIYAFVTLPCGAHIRNAPKKSAAFQPNSLRTAKGIAMNRLEKFSPSTSRASPQLVDAYVRRGNRLRSQAVHAALARLAGALRRLLARQPRRARARAA